MAGLRQRVYGLPMARDQLGVSAFELTRPFGREMIAARDAVIWHPDDRAGARRGVPAWTAMLLGEAG
jgi:hypothetical protein